MHTGIENGLKSLFNRNLIQQIIMDNLHKLWVPLY